MSCFTWPVCSVSSLLMRYITKNLKHTYEHISEKHISTDTLSHITHPHAKTHQLCRMFNKNLTLTTSESYYQHRAQGSEAGGITGFSHDLGKTRITQNIDLWCIIPMKHILTLNIILSTNGNSKLKEN